MFDSFKTFDAILSHIWLHHEGTHAKLNSLPVKHAEGTRGKSLAVKRFNDDVSTSMHTGFIVAYADCAADCDDFLTPTIPTL